MKNLVLLIAAGCCCMTVKAQNLSWAKTLNTTYNDYIRDIQVDKDGNLFTCGQFSLTVDFDPGPGTALMSSAGGNGSDIFIAKYDSSGNYLWSHSFGSGFFYDDAGQLATDTAGNVLLTGFFGSSVDFNPDSMVNNFLTAGNNMRSRFLLKLDKDGNFIQVKKVGDAVGMLPSSQDAQTGLACDLYGNIYMSGFYGTTLVLDTGSMGSLSVSGLSDNYFCKYDTALNLVWANRLGSSGTEYSQGMYVSSNGTVIAMGSFSNTVDFDPGAGVFLLSQVGSNINGYFAMYDSAGNFIFARQLVGGNNCAPIDITMDSKKNIILTGSAAGVLDADPGPDSAMIGSGFNDQVILCAYDSMGNYRWAFAFGDINAYQAGKSVATDSADNIYLAGSYEPFVDLDPGPDTAVLGNYYSGFVALYDTGGKYRTAFNSHESITKLALQNEAIYLAGGYYGLIDFDPGPQVYTMMSDTANASWYLLKLNGCTDIPTTPGQIILPAICAGDTLTATVNQGGPSYEWYFSAGLSAIGSTTGDSVTVIVGGAATSESILCRSIGGCINSAFSYININVNQPVVPVIIQQLDTLYASPASVSYQWYYNGSIIAGATDSVYAPSASGLYIVITTDSNGCQAISAPYNFTLSGLAVTPGNTTVVYPNPFTDYFIMEFSVPQNNASVLLMDVSGKTLLKEILNGSRLMIEAGHLEPGMYFLEWRLAETIQRKVMVKL